MTVDLDALEALAKAATPGPWAHYETMQADNHVTAVTAGGGILTGTHVCGPTYEKKNAEFIAAADPSTVLALIAELRQERERADKNEAGWGEAFRLAVAHQDALSRAEETIEKAKAMFSEDAPINESSWVPDETYRILTEYGKQKEN